MISRPNIADVKVLQLPVAQGVLSEELSRDVERRVVAGDGKQSIVEHVVATGAASEELHREAELLGARPSSRLASAMY